MPGQQSNNSPLPSPPPQKPLIGADVKPSQQLLDELMNEKHSTSQGMSSPTHPGSSSVFTPRARTAHFNIQDLYARKFRKLKRAIKDAIFVNGAVCDEVLRTEEKLAKAKEERRFLLRKLLQYQSVNEPNIGSLKSEPQTPNSRQAKGLQGNLSADGANSEHSGKPKTMKRKMLTANPSLSSGASAASLLSASLGNPATQLGVGGPSETKKKNTQSTKDPSDTPTVRPKKGKGAIKKVIPPLMLDSLGRPIFPMVLGDITLHSIGEIVPDRLSFHSVESIYPVGFCITRVFASLHKLDTKCLYTCKISDNNDGPLFEIAAEDSSDIVFKSTSPTDCHSQLLWAVNKSRGASIVQAEGQGLAFFGLSHPVIQNLIQSCPGARKCSRYKWVKFEINKAETNENVAVGTNDPSISYEAFKAHMQSVVGQKRAALPAHVEQSTNLRSLLTKGNSGLS